MRLSVSGGRTVVKGEFLLSVVLRNVFRKNVVILPELQNFLLPIEEVKRRVNFFIQTTLQVLNNLNYYKYKDICRICKVNFDKFLISFRFFLKKT